MVLGTIHGCMVGEMDHVRMALEVLPTAAAQENRNQGLSTSSAGDGQSKAVPDSAEAGGAGAAIGEAVDILPMKDLVVVDLEGDST